MTNARNVIGRFDAPLLALRLATTPSQHLLISVNGGSPEVDGIRAQLRSVQLIKLDTRCLTAEAVRRIGSEKKAILLRPDGYVGFRGGSKSARQFQAYARQNGLIRDN
jgi:hypothetical protein